MTSLKGKTTMNASNKCPPQRRNMKKAATGLAKHKKRRKGKRIISTATWCSQHWHNGDLREVRRANYDFVRYKNILTKAATGLAKYKKRRKGKRSISIATWCSQHWHNGDFQELRRANYDFERYKNILTKAATALAKRKKRRKGKRIISLELDDDFQE